MIVKKPMTNSLREKISQYKKSGVDISSLISNVDIKGEDLSYCYISELNIVKQDISNCNLSNSKIKLIANNAKLKDCLFIRTRFLPGSSLRGADCRRSNFRLANCGFLDYAFADLRGCNICGTLFSVASKYGQGAKVSENVIDLLKKYWEILPGDPMLDINEE